MAMILQFECQVSFYENINPSMVYFDRLVISASLPACSLSFLLFQKNLTTRDRAVFINKKVTNKQTTFRFYNTYK